MDQSSKLNKRKLKVPKKVIFTEEKEETTLPCIITPPVSTSYEPPPTPSPSSSSSCIPTTTPAAVSESNLPEPKMLPSVIMDETTKQNKRKLKVPKKVPEEKEPAKTTPHPAKAMPKPKASVAAGPRTALQCLPTSTSGLTNLKDKKMCSGVPRIPVAVVNPFLAQLRQPLPIANVSTFTAKKSSPAKPKHPINAKQPVPTSSTASASSSTQTAKAEMKPTPTNKPKPKYNNKEHPEIMTFHPTWEEFKDFPKYISYMESRGAHLAGVAKIIPPPEYKPLDKNIFAKLDEMVIPAPLCQIKSSTGQIGAYQNLNIVKKAMSVADFKAKAYSTEFSPPTITKTSTNAVGKEEEEAEVDEDAEDEELERKYWKTLLYGEPIYGSDVNGTLTKLDYKYWNMNNLGTILNLVEEESNIIIAGVTTAYLYFGMWKTLFCWHTEDMDLYSINYLHYGASKTWYAIPPQNGKLFEKIAATYFPKLAKECKGFLRHKTTILSPLLLKHHSRLGVNKITQRMGEIMITFPFGYHSGFNHGFNIAESTNFAMPRWIEYGKRTQFCTCPQEKVVKIDMEIFVRKFQPDRLKLWLAGIDEGRHPEDDPKTTKMSFAPKPSVKFEEEDEVDRDSDDFGDGKRKIPMSVSVLPAEEANVKETDGNSTAARTNEGAEHERGTEAEAGLGLEPSPAKKKKKSAEYDMDSDEELDFIFYEEAYKKAGVLVESSEEEEDASDWEDELDPETGRYKDDPLAQPQQQRSPQGQPQQKGGQPVRGTGLGR